MKKAKKKDKIKLSFQEEEDKTFVEEDHQAKRRRFAKNPDVDTSFLPDRERENQERLEREELRKQWLAEQERIKNETIEITYSYWDGSGHRKTVEVSVAIGDALTIVQERRRHRCFLGEMPLSVSGTW